MADRPTLDETDWDADYGWVVLDPGDAQLIKAVLSGAASEGDLYGEQALQAMVRSIEKCSTTCPMCGQRWHHGSAYCEDPDAPEPSSPFALYRLIDATGRVLYVGITRNLRARLRVHRRNWGELFDHVIVEHYPDAATMLEAEAQAIHDEQPPLNSDGIG